ncbi:MAG TPA: hypothetical protein VFQ80_01650 [Thermomicrobiales bacterium]|nr:hypothetical protein [Thermomicrobiales bacterium]
MVLSIGRVRPRWQGATDREADAAPVDRAAWLAERGDVRWTLTAELTGAWPGFGRDGGRRAGAKVRISERQLLVDEERPRGFALPLTTIADAGLVGRETAAGAALLVRYRHRDGLRSFLIEPRGVRLFRQDQGLDGAVAALRAAGVTVGEFELAPTLAVDWTRARAFAEENVIWSGLATAPDDLWGEQAPADVWLSTRSLLWSRPGANHLLRLPLEAIADATPFAGERRGAYGVSIGAVDAASGRAELTLSFDRHAMTDRNARERGAFLVGLRSRGIPVAAEPAPAQPWRDGAWSRSPATEPPQTLVRDAVANPATTEPDAAALDQPEPTSLWPTWTAAADDDGATVNAKEAAADDAATSDDDAGADMDAPPPDASILARAAAFEAGALRVLAAIHGGERAAGRLLIGTSLAGATVDLEQAAAVGALTPEEAARRHDRLVALNEATIRLRALAELRASGYLNDGDFERKRRTILEPLADRVFLRT